jgi:hypothetical protein
VVELHKLCLSVLRCFGVCFPGNINKLFRPPAALRLWTAVVFLAIWR